MAIKEKTQDAPAFTIDDIQVENVHAFETKSKKIDTSIGFTMVVKGIKIYGCVYNEGNVETDNEWHAINFPSRAGNDGKYYNHVWFPISKKLTEDIAELLGQAL